LDGLVPVYRLRLTSLAYLSSRPSPMDNGQWPMVIRDRVRTPDNNGNPTWMLSWMRFYQGLSMMHFQDEDEDED